MKKTTILIFLLINSFCFSQNSEIENLINQIAAHEVPENYNFYYLVQQSLRESETKDSISSYQKIKLLRQDLNFPLELTYKPNKQTINWKKFNLKNNKFVINKYNYPTTSPPIRKKVIFVKFNINDDELNRLITNKKPHTLIVKKKWFWNKKRIYHNKKFHQELLKAWELDKKK